MKDKTTAAFLALFLGMFGVHRFYLRQPGLGILYFFLLFVGMVSILLGIIDAIVLFSMDQEEFDRRYNEEGASGEYDRYRRRTTGRYRHREQTRNRGPQTRRRTNEFPRSRTARHVPERQRSNPYIQSGIKKYKDFELEDAIIDFNKGLEISPRDVALHFNIACAYSLTEKPDKAFYHLDQAVEYGFSDFDRIRTHDDLAYVRIQPQFDEFADAGFRLKKDNQDSKAEPEQTGSEHPEEPGDDKLLSQLQRLAELRDKGLITDREFTAEKEKLMR